MNPELFIRRDGSKAWYTRDRTRHNVTDNKRFLEELSRLSLRGIVKVRNVWIDPETGITIVEFYQGGNNA